MIKEKCPNCGSEEISYDDSSDETFCLKCGFVLGYKPVEESPVKLPSNFLLQKGIVGLVNVGRKKQFKSTSVNSSERSYMLATDVIMRTTTELELPNIVGETGLNVYVQIMKKGLTQGRRIEKVAVGSLFGATMICKLYRPLNLISGYTGIKKNVILSSWKFIESSLEIKVDPVIPESYVPYVCLKLGLNQMVADRANNVIDIARKSMLIEGKEPTVIAGASIHIASMLTGFMVTMKRICELTEVTEATLNLRAEEILSTCEAL